ncbi:MAG: tryptophan-rich sensory protein [Clostridia bacterium]|nr:tryptophan-rich sensory protein [Lachnospiraceae bacterium]NCC00691.1 tryptophan-rich sensory protein [Clostridia bacterium]NCD02704.1 tryptophan-rich sensory protein [Clostridia bacterium]
MNIQFKKLILYLAIPLAIGALTAFLIRDSIPIYEGVRQPPASPPTWLFPVVWTILYILMGISSYIVGVSHSSEKAEALGLYGLQLFLNFLWPLIFFNAQNYLLAFIILVLLWYVLFKMIREFWQISPIAGKLQIPYILWSTFAAYLNLGVYLLNR